MKENGTTRLQTMGIAFIILGIVANEWILEWLFSPDKHLEFRQRAIIWAVDIVLISFGIILYAGLRIIRRSANLILLVGSVGLSLALGELALRVLDNKPWAARDVGAKIELSEEYRYDYKAGQTFYKSLPEPSDYLSIENKINSMGIRGPEILHKTELEFRVLLLGDSFIAAAEMPFELTVGQVLENLISDPNVRVIQKGVPGWSPLLELNWLIKKGLKLQPDAVVLFLVLNDFYPKADGLSDEAYTREAVFDDNGLPLSFHVEAADPKLWQASRLLLLLNRAWAKGTPSCRDGGKQLNQERLEHLLSVEVDSIEADLKALVPRNCVTGNLNKHLIRLSRPSRLWGEDTRKTVSITLGYLTKMNEILSEMNVPFFIALVPFAWNVSLIDDMAGRKYYGVGNTILPMGGIEEVMQRFSEENRIPYVNLHRALTAYEADHGGPLYIRDDGHWNSTGHSVVAKTVHESLSRLLPRKPTALIAPPAK